MGTLLEEALQTVAQSICRPFAPHELGFTYRDADLTLVATMDLRLSPEEAAQRTGVQPDVIARVRARVDSVAWKRVVPHVL